MKVTEAWVGQAAASSGAPGADAYGICNDADVTLLQDRPERGGSGLSEKTTRRDKAANGG